MEAFFRQGYFKDLGALDMYGPKVSHHFGVPLWHLILFSNHIEQAMVRTLHAISNQRPSLSFYDLYEELIRNRFKRLKGRKTGENNLKHLTFGHAIRIS